MIAVLLLVVVASSIWVGFDSTGRDWSENRLTHNPFEWFIGCLLLWIILFPAYLAQRSRTPLKDQ
jgi:hypothetical protein